MHAPSYIPYLSHGFMRCHIIFPVVANGGGSQGNQLQNNMQKCQISCYIKVHESTEGCGDGQAQ